MKTLFFSIAVLLCFSTAVFAELSVSDLEKIRQIVNEAEVRTEKRINEAEVRTEKRINEVQAQLEQRIAEQSERFSAEIRAQGDRITEQGKRLDFHGALLITLIGAIIAFVGLPLAFIIYQFNKYSVREYEIKTLREKIEALEKKHILRA